MNLEDGSTANGANIEILSKNYKDAQQVMFVENESEDAYTIRPRSTNNATGIGVSGASKESGANIVSWAINGSTDQEWILEKVTHPGIAMDTNVIYEFKNVNSEQVMDIESGKMENGTNVQQWGTGHFKSQQWTLKEFSGGGNYYYIQSTSNPNYVLKAESSSNGGNISIAEYSTKDSSMLFKFCKNPDGTYSITTRASKDACLVEVADASIASGANVQQWEPTNSDCQKWNAETFTTTSTTTTTTVTTTTTTIVTDTTTVSDTQTTTPIETTTTSIIVNPILFGDTNCDGSVSVADAVAVSAYVSNAEKNNISEQGLINSDVHSTGNGLNASDALMIQQYATGIIDSLN